MGKKPKGKILIPRPQELKRKIRAFRKGGTDSLHVISDFDRDAHKTSSKGNNVSTSYDPLERGIGSAEFIRKSRKMTAYYYPIRDFQDHSVKNKSKKMEEWWRKYYSLAINTG